MILLILILVITILLASFFFVKKMGVDVSISNKATYGEKITYKKGIAIQFPDFTLTYTGDKLLSGKNGATWNIVFNLFEISDGEIHKEVSWSSGTGNIVPNPFEFNGKKYSLEKALSDKFGQLKPDELIVNIEK